MDSIQRGEYCVVEQLRTEEEDGVACTVTPLVDCKRSADTTLCPPDQMVLECCGFVRGAAVRLVAETCHTCVFLDARSCTSVSSSALFFFVYGGKNKTTTINATLVLLLIRGSGAVRAHTRHGRSALTGVGRQAWWRTDEHRSPAAVS